MNRNVALLWEDVIFKLNKNSISTPNIDIIFKDEALQQEVIDFALKTGIDDIVGAAKKCKPYIGEIMSDLENKQYKDTLTEVENFLNPSHIQKKEVIVNAETSIDWELLEQCAKEISGPIGTIVTKKVKASGQVDTTLEAATKMATFLGDFSSEFLSLVKENI